MDHIFGLSDNSALWLLYSCTLSKCSKSSLKLNPQNGLMVAQLRPHWQNTAVVFCCVSYRKYYIFFVFFFLKQTTILDSCSELPFHRVYLQCVLVHIHFFYTCPRWTSSIFIYIVKIMFLLFFVVFAKASTSTLSGNWVSWRSLMNQYDNAVMITNMIWLSSYVWMPRSWEVGVATLTPMLKNHSDFIGQKVPKYAQQFCLNITKSEASFMAEFFFVDNSDQELLNPLRAETLPSSWTGSSLRATATQDFQFVPSSFCVGRKHCNKGIWR